MTHHTSWVRIAIAAGFLVVAVVRLVIYIRRGR
jgi:hypothetical protein